MARNSVGTSRSLTSGAADVGRHRENDGVIGGERNGLAAEIERLDLIAGKAQRAQLVLKAQHRAALLQMRQRRLDQRRAKALAGNQRPAGATAGGKRLADDGGGEPRRALRRIDVERREQKRLDQALIERAVAGDDVADRLAGSGAQQPRQRQIIEHAGAGHAPLGVENPQRQTAVVEAQRPALAARQIDEREFGMGRADQPVRGADVAQISERGVVARQQEVIAVVDRHADRGVVIGAAAAAGETPWPRARRRCGRAPTASAQRTSRQGRRR